MPWCRVGLFEYHRGQREVNQVIRDISVICMVSARSSQEQLSSADRAASDTQNLRPLDVKPYLTFEVRLFTSDT